MAELDERTRRDLVRLRDRAAPSGDVTDRVLAKLEAQLGGSDGDGDGGEGLDPGLVESSVGRGVDVAFAAKVVAATVGLTGAGLLALKLAAVVIAGVSPESKGTVVEARAQPERELDSSPSTAEPEHEAGPAPEQATPEPASEVADGPTELSIQGEASTGKAAAKPTPDDTDTLAAELALLESARATMDPYARLELLERHLEGYPAGTLAAERDLLRVTANCELGRSEDARELAEAFVSQHPRTPFRARLRSACPELDLPAEEKSN